MSETVLYRKIIKELEKRERGGKWTLNDKPHPLPTAGAILLLHKEGKTYKHHTNVLQEISRRSRDAESLRYILRAQYELGLPTTETENTLRKLFHRGMWRIMEGFPPDPLTTSAILVALHNTPLLRKERQEAIVSIKYIDMLPHELATFIGGQRPVTTSLYRALALTLYGEEKEARKIWNKLKGIRLVDLPPKTYLESGIKEDVYYPAVLASLLAKHLNENPRPYLRVLDNFTPEKEDTARLVTIGFYLAKFLGKL